MARLTMRVDHVVAHVGDGLGDVFLVHQFETLLEDDLALVIHHVVVFEDVLADVEVARFDAALRRARWPWSPMDG